MFFPLELSTLGDVNCVVELDWKIRELRGQSVGFRIRQNEGLKFGSGSGINLFSALLSFLIYKMGIIIVPTT